MTIDDFIVYAVLLGSIFILGGAAVLALSWSVRSGQFQNFERSARSIFDPAEPIGEGTDLFPDLAGEGRPAGTFDEVRASGPIGNTGDRALG